jgi:hypothetical protein
MSQELIVKTVKESDGFIREEFEVLRNRKSVKNGYYKRFYNDGKVNINATFLDNKLNGKWESLHPEGIVAAAGGYVSDQMSGEWEYHDADGSLCVKGSYTDDRENGTWEYYRPGNFRMIVHYSSGVPDGNWEFFHDNQPVARCRLIDGKYGPETFSLSADSLMSAFDTVYIAPDEPALFYMLRFSKKERPRDPTPGEPRFYKGMPAVKSYLAEYVTLPLSLFPTGNNPPLIKKTCYAQITISRSGIVEKVEILRSFSADLDRELTDTILKMPVWMPAINRGIPVRSVITVPFTFESFVI